jgi:hypothetical protein
MPAEACLPWQIEGTCTDNCDSCEFDFCPDSCDYPLAWASFIDSSDGASFATDTCYHFVTGDSLKRAILNHGPVRVMGMFDDTALVSYGANPDTGAYNFDPYWEAGDAVQTYGHYYVVYGWNDTCTGWTDSTRTIPVWLAKNSWGSEWGEPGPDDSGEASGCFKFVQYSCGYRIGIDWVKWTPLCKTSLSGPTDYSA